MKFLRVSFHNVGVFQGWHEIPLVADNGANAERPITLIRGKNGAGKSTLFTLFRVALYGAGAFGERIGTQAYQRRLAHLFHEHPTNGAGNRQDLEHAGVEIQFEVVRSGQPRQVIVTRSWRKRDDRATEDLIVTEDGKKIDVPAGYEQDWIHEVVPSGHQSLLFFDGEQLEALSSPDRYQSMLRSILERLLNLDHVDRLVSDLKRNVSTRSRNLGDVEERREVVLEFQGQIDGLDAHSEKVQIELESNAEQIAELRQQVAHVESRLTNEGAAYANRREEWEAREIDLEKEREDLRDQLHELSAGLLPFALAPRLARQLQSRLKHEQEIRQKKAASTVLDELFDELRHDLQEGEPAAVSDESALLKRLQERAGAKLALDDESARLVHDLADQDAYQLSSLIDEALEETGPHAKTVAAGLGSVQNELASVRENLRRVPSDEVLAPPTEELNQLREQIDALESRQHEMASELETNRLRRETLVRQHEQAVRELQAAQSAGRGTDLAQRSQVVLRAFREARLRNRLIELEAYVIETFNKLCRKEHLLESIHIAPSDFSLTLRGATDLPDVRLESLSAGERQLFALSMLQALREVSNRELPLIMDTPLARLDEAHRDSVLTEYLPHVAEQSLLLATDAEIDDSALAMIRDRCAHAFVLNHDQDARMTTIGKLSSQASTPQAGPANKPFDSEYQNVARFSESEMVLT